MKGVKIGHFSNNDISTGVSVLLCEEGAVCGVDVRGGAPGTRETDLLKGCNSVAKINAVVLSGGSAFGLASCDGVMRYLYEKKKGFDTGTQIVPIVCGAVIYDLDENKFGYPDSEYGKKACLVAEENNFSVGRIGGGCGATVGKLFGGTGSSLGGVGCVEVQLTNGVSIGALVVVNAFGDVVDFSNNGKIIAGAMQNGQFVNTTKFILNNICVPTSVGTNTTIGCVYTNARLTREQANKLASISHNGLALSISPIHTMMDGDTMFALSTNEVECDFNTLLVACVDVVAKSVLSAIVSK